MPTKNKKASVGFFSLTSCEGCYFALIDLREKFLELTDKIEIKNFRLFEEVPHIDEEKFDIAFVEGSPLTDENFKFLKRLRKNTKVLIALGACAHMGGIYHMKQYTDKAKAFSHVYDGNIGIENYDVKTVAEVVPVDYSIPGCPINAKEFLNFVYQLLKGKKPTIDQNPVCYECQNRGYECLLQKGEVCLGPITQGGCEAICLKSKQGCWGCRGLVEDAEVENLIKKLREKFSDKEISKYLEVFGIKEMLNR